MVGDWRQHRPLLLLPAALALFSAVVLGVWAAGLADPWAHLWTNRDFANYWFAARLVAEGRATELFAGIDVYFNAMIGVFGRDYPWHAWSYPPHYLLLIAPLGLLPYLPSGLLFLLATLMLYVLAIKMLSPRMTVVTTALLVPFVLGNVVAGQNGFLTAALLLFGLALRDRAPVIAGIAIGVLTVKPQLGFLLPLLLLYERRWSVIAAAAATAAAMVGLSVLLFGLDSWIGFFAKTVPYQSAVMRELGGIFTHMVPSVYGSMRSLNLVADTALMVHWPVAFAACVLFGWSLTALTDTDARGRSLLFATVMISPYSLNYDLGALIALIVIRLEPPQRLPGQSTKVWPDGVAQILMIFVAMLPLLTPPLGELGLPLSPLILAAAWGLMIVVERRR